MWIEASFAWYEQFEDVLAIISKAGTATRDIARKKRIPVLVEGHWTYCWPCGASRHMSKVYPSKNMAPQTRPTTSTLKTVEESGKATDGPGVWKDVVRRGKIPKLRNIPPIRKKIPVVVLKNINTELSQLLEKSFNCCLKEKSLPNLWIMSSVCQVFKNASELSHTF